MREETGYIGSFIIHATIVGVAFLLASLTTEVREVAEQDPLLLEVWKGDGSERDPGIPGAARGIAEGVTTGDKSKTGLGAKTFAPLKKMNADKFLKEMRENEAKAAAQKDPDGDGPKKPSKKETLDDFNKANGKHTKGGRPTSGGAPGGTSNVGSNKGKPGIAGTSVGDSGTGRGTGRDGLGHPGGHGKNGGDGGSGNAEKLFVGAVKGAFADVYIPMFREQGGETSGSNDKGTIRLMISESGLISFEWIRKPDPVIARIVEAAINRMKPIPPPDGKPCNITMNPKGTLESE